MINELYIIWNTAREQISYYDTYRSFIIVVQKMKGDEFNLSSFEVLVYDEEYIDVCTGDEELSILDHETGEDLRSLIYAGQYNFDKARIYNLNPKYLELNFRS